MTTVDRGSTEVPSTAEEREDADAAELLDLPVFADARSAK